MIETVYGHEDPDGRLLAAVRAFAAEQGAQELLLILHQRQPLGSRPCKRPGSLTYEFALDKTKGFTARQEKNGTVKCPLVPGD